MARSLDGLKLVAQLAGVLQNDIDGVADAAGVSLGSKFTPATALTSGTAANKADIFWADRDRTVTSGNTEDIDVYDLGSLDVGAGAGKDALGQAVTMAEIVAVLIECSAASAGTLLVGGKAASTAWNSLFNGDDDAVLVVKPGGAFLVFAPTDPAYAVADTSNHLLTMAASGGNVTYSITILGRSA